MRYIYRGIDGGSYVIKQGRLIKIVKVEYSPDYMVSSVGYAKYTLEDGSEIIIN